MASSELPSRAALQRARRVCIKSGTSVVANEDGRPSLTRLGTTTEQIAELHRDGIEVSHFRQLWCRRNGKEIAS